MNARAMQRCTHRKLHRIGPQTWQCYYCGAHLPEGVLNIRAPQPDRLRCLDCNAAGLRNCGHFDECNGRWELQRSAVTSGDRRTYGPES
jgi:hypothetical protein